MSKQIEKIIETDKTITIIYKDGTIITKQKTKAKNSGSEDKNKSGKVVKHQRIYEILCHDILKGVYRPGDNLPTEKELSESHHMFDDSENRLDCTLAFSIQLPAL